jgi:Ras GTPase-activating protein 1
MYLFFNITEEVSTLFRATSLATTLMDQYMKMTASQFVSDAIKEYILKIIDSKQSCEVWLLSSAGDIFLF